jgi:hypothetical protein
MQWWLQLSEVVRNVLLLVGGSIGIYLAWLRVSAANRQAEAQIESAEASVRQADIGRRKLVGDLFLQAVGQLRDEKLEVRLFAVYTLRRIAEDETDYSGVVVELLSAYLRDNQKTYGDGPIPVDIEEITRIITRSVEAKP